MSEQGDNDHPQMDNQKVPLWIKLMWLIGVIWMIWYFISGVNSSPSEWV